MDTFELAFSERVLTVLFVGAALWFVAGMAFEVALVSRGRNRRRTMLPRWMRVAAVSVVSTIAIPKVAEADAVVGATPMDDASSPERGKDDLVLAGSLVANAAFAGIHLRRHLVRLRQQRFSVSADTDDLGNRKSVSVSSSPDIEAAVIVRVFGPPMAETSSGRRITFEKGKALELLVWMAEHRETSTRSAARTALWDGAVKDSTFANVVSEVRRALGSALPDRDDDWIPRTFTDELPLHPEVVTDAQILEEAIRRFEGDRSTSIADLVTALGAIRNLPFSGADYGWADGSGITTSHVIKAVRAAVLVGEYAIECNDNDLLFMATERGLRVLPGHEELVALRMRGHARSGNRSAIKFEWESYARAIEADSWAGAVPSPELEELARELSRA